jgi:hypothetical protein
MFEFDLHGQYKGFPVLKLSRTSRGVNSGTCSQMVVYDASKWTDDEACLHERPENHILH